MIETRLLVEEIKDGDVLTALSNIFDGCVDADWTGENEEEFWSEEAQSLHKPDKEIVEEYLAAAYFNSLEELVEAYINEYDDRSGHGYYENITYVVKRNDKGKPIALAVSLSREE